MTDCEYCSESFDGDDAYLRHLGDEHPDEMGPIERRRLEELGGTSDGPTTPLIVAGIAVGALLLAIILYTLTTGGSNSELGELGPAPIPGDHELGPPGNDETYRPYQLGSVHEHGDISVNVDGTEIDFSRDEFQHYRDIRSFHFEPDPFPEPKWHAHAKGVTLEFALEATAFGVTEDSFAYDGVVYRTGSNESAPDGWTAVTGATIEYTVNGTTVDPETYVLQPNDRIEVRVEAPGDTNPSGGMNETTENESTSTAARLA